MKKLLYIFSHAPYSNSHGQEGLDALLIGASFEQDVSVLFLHDGVFQLLQNQHASATQLKQYTKAFAALEDFGVEHIYVHEPSLMARGITQEQLIIPIEVVNGQSSSMLIAEQFRVFTF